MQYGSREKKALPTPPINCSSSVLVLNSSPPLMTDLMVNGDTRAMKVRLSLIMIIR